MIPAVIYLRMSKDTQDTSIPAQRVAIIKYAKDNGYKIIREYADHGISGDLTEKRTEFQRLLADSAKGDFKVILCWDQDRFGRFDLLEAGYWIKPLRDNGISLVTIAQGKIDWTDFAGRLVYTIQQKGKHQFLRDLSRNVNRGKIQAVKDKRWMGGDAPFGYDLNSESRLVINETEAAVVREVFRLYVAGNSSLKVRKILNERGVPSPGGGLWYGETVRRIVTSQVYIGNIVYNQVSRGRYTRIANDAVVPKANAKGLRNDPSLWMVETDCHKPIVSKKTFEAAQQATKTHKAWVGPASERIIFRSILRCARCGKTMHGNFVPKMNDVAYKCNGHHTTGACDPNRCYQKPLLAAIKDVIQQEWLDPVAIEAAKQVVLKQYQDALPVDVSGLKRKRDTISVKIAKAEARLLEVPSDMVATVVNQIRDLRSELDQANADIAAAGVPVTTIRTRAVRLIDEAVEHFKAIARSLETALPQDLKPLFQDCVESIFVRSEKRNIGPNGKYELVSVRIVAKNTGKLH